MTKIEQVVKEVSELRDFYLRIEHMRPKSEPQSPKDSITASSLQVQVEPSSPPKNDPEDA